MLSLPLDRDKQAKHKEGSLGSDPHRPVMPKHTHVLCVNLICKFFEFAYSQHRCRHQMVSSRCPAQTAKRVSSKG